MRSADDRFEYRDRADLSLVDGAEPLNVHRFAFRCRSQPDAWCSLNLRGRGHDIANRSWSWDGDFERPTLSPSIDCKHCWHGFIEAGVFNDSSHQPEPVQ